MINPVRIAGDPAGGTPDQEIAAVLDELAALNLPGVETLTPAQARAGRPIQKYSLADEPGVTVKSITVPGPGGDIPVRTYHPCPGTVLPAVVFSHGGGWVLGDLESHDHVCRFLAAAVHCTVISVGYRLAPEYPFPAGLEDVSAVLRWVQNGQAGIDADPGRVAVCGDSAGGNLSIAVCLRARDEGYPLPAYMALIYPVTDLSSFATESHLAFTEGYFLTRAQMEWFRGHYLLQAADAADPYVSPLLAEDLSGLPPAHIITAELDPLRDEAETFALCLAKSGVPVTCTRYNGAVHAFTVMGGASALARQALAETADKLREAFGS